MTATARREWQGSKVAAARSGAFDDLVAFIKGRKGKPFVEDFSDFEREFWERVRALGRAVFTEELSKADVDAEAIVVEGIVHRRVLRGTETYMTTAGPVVVERTLYKDRTDPGARAISAFESRAGVMAGFWMPLAAQQATWLVAQMTPTLAREALRRIGMMQPSKSTMDRLPKELSGRWEDDRERFEAELRETITIPEGTHAIAVSIDGVLAPMKDGDAAGVRARTAAEGKQSKGPAGYREVGCATLTFCDAQGQQISAIRMARMPEHKKATLKRSLLAEVLHVLTLGRNLKVVKIADAAGDNWDFLAGPDLPAGTELVDFFHAAEHLHGALAAAYGDGTPKTRERFATLRHLLLDEAGGVEKVIRALHYLRNENPRTPRIAEELAYFRRHRKRMNYAEVKAQGLPIGSGVVEAACKTLVAQRMKQSGMRWGMEGGQAILSARGWCQSDRFDKAWALIAATYRVQVTTLDNVVPLRRPS